MNKISIITPTLNSAQSIETAILSVANQSYRNIEHLIIDGCSNDNTVEIVRKYQEKYSNIKVLSEKDKGIYDAMNKGIKISSGEWLYFLGSDDRIFNSQVIECIHKLIVCGDCDVIYGDVVSKRFQGRYDGEFTYEKILFKNICHQSIFFKKTIFSKTGLFNLKYKSHADWNHNFQWFLSSSIKKKYYDIVVADYADYGYSSLNYDELFEKDKVINYLKYGSRILPFNTRLSFLKRELRKSFNRNDFIFLLKIGLIIPKVIYGI